MAEILRSTDKAVTLFGQDDDGLRDREGVSARIAELRGKIVRRIERNLEVDIDRLTREFARIGLANVSDVIAIQGGRVTVKDTAELSEDVLAAISEIRSTREGVVVVKMHDKVRALENLARHFAYFKEANISVGVSLIELINASFDPNLPPLPSREPHIEQQGE